MGRLFVKILRKVVHTTVGIKTLSITKYLNPTTTLDWFDIHQFELTLPRLPGVFDGYQVVHISDFHLGTWLTRSQLAEIIHVVNQHQPDIILITGDFVTFRPELFIDDLTAELRRLKPKATRSTR
jgi:predicted MPP superfamily phosphohydrolase